MICSQAEIGEGGYVDAGTLPAFVADVPELYRQDLLNSTLLGQLAADKLYSRTAQPQEWYKHYFATLGRVGWNCDTFDFKPLRLDTATFTFEEIALRLIAKKVTATELALATKALRSLRDLPDDDPRVIVFNGNTHSKSAVNAQVSVRTPSVMVNVGLVFTTGQEVTSLLVEEFETQRLDGDIQTLVQVTTLNELIYTTVRKSVIEKLGPRRKKLILELDIAQTAAMNEATTQGG